MAPLSPAGLALLHAEYDNMLACIRCGACLTSCPTYLISMHEAEGPRGRISMMRALTEGRLEPTPDLIEHEQNCLVCDACTAVCPAGIHMDPMQVALRAAIEPEVRRAPLERTVRRLAFGHLFADMKTFRRFARLLWLYQRSGLQRLVRGSRVLHLLRLAEAESLLPPVARCFLTPRGEVYAAEDAAEGSPPTERVSFFAGCVMSTALAEIDRATIRVLQRAGCTVENTAGQGCCGALNAHAGDLDGAAAIARHTIAAFENDSGGPIVVNSAGCGAMLKDYAHHFRDDPEWSARAAAFSRRVRDITEFLAPRRLPLRRPLDLTASFQDPCHLAHAQRITKQPRALLQALPGVELREMAESSLCCGSAGVYNVTNPEQSRRLQERKVDHALSAGVGTVVTANPGCLLQLRTGLKRRGSDVQVRHIVELLDEATAP